MLSRRLFRIKVIKALFAHLKSGADSMALSERELLASVERAYDLYFHLLTLPVALADYAAGRQELARRKQLPTYEDLHPNTRFVDNAVIRAIAATDAVNDQVAARRLSWDPDLVRTLYGQLVEMPGYKAYMGKSDSSFVDDRAFIEQLFEEWQECEALDTALEEESVQWADDLPFVAMLLFRTVANLRSTQSEVRIVPKFKSDEDLEFIKTLFERSLVHFDQNQRYIERFTANWDIDRMVFMDNLILGVAMTELIEFPSIPVRVTLDEYIEISKYYSTPGSSLFINGVLDKIVAALTEEGRIQKSGRGLM